MPNLSQTVFESSLGRVCLGVSACLLGAPVRFDGGHKRNRFIIEQLGEHFDFLAFRNATRRALAPGEKKRRHSCCWGVSTKAPGS
jgi:hypothetical protein